MVSREKDTKNAAALLQRFKGDGYIFGLHCSSRLGSLAARFGGRVAVVTSGIGKPWGSAIHEATREALSAAEVTLAGDFVRGPRPNAPREDVFRIAETLAESHADAVVCVGGGSCIDATKAALAYDALRDRYPDLDAYFGVDQVTAKLRETGRALPPLLAVQLASGSAAHLTKYANITTPERAQKLLMADNALTPPLALFDYAMTRSAPCDLTMDGGLDGIAHCLEVLYGLSEAKTAEYQPALLLGIRLIVGHLKTACGAPGNLEARQALGLGTDLGGFAIMIGGTNGAHLTSFSLVDVLSHGRACAIMNPYFTVLFAPAIEDKLRAIGTIYRDTGHTDAPLDRIHGRDLGIAVAEAMRALSRDVGIPTALGEVPGFTHEHVARTLDAAENPALEMKLRNMPVPMTPQTVRRYMEPLLEAAQSGDFRRVPNIAKA